MRGFSRSGEKLHAALGGIVSILRLVGRIGVLPRTGRLVFSVPSTIGLILSLSPTGVLRSIGVSSFRVDLFEVSRPALPRALRAALLVWAYDGFPFVAVIALAVVASQDGGWLFAVGAFLHSGVIIAFRFSARLQFRLFLEDFDQESFAGVGGFFLHFVLAAFFR